MRKHAGTVIPTLILLLVGCAFGARAEVSAELDSLEDYVRTVILANSSMKNLRIWSVVRARTDMVPLNPDGDARGDLWPVIGELPQSRGAWVVWSAFNGEEYDLAWSRWLPEGRWRDPAWLAASDAVGDDLDTDITVEPDGRPYIAWWREENGIGRVFISFYLSTRWLAPYLVSDAGVDSRYPRLDLDEDGDIRVTYHTPDGRTTKVVVFRRPDTITDELNPFSSLTVEDAPSGGPDEAGPVH